MTVEHEKFLLAQKLAKMTAQMEAIKRGSSATSRATSPPLEPDLLTREQFIKQELLDDYPYSLPTPQNSHGAPSSSYSSPSPPTYSESSTPATVSLGVDALTTSSDMTQHPAAMLCDLQCQSERARQTATPPTAPRAAATPSYSANLAYLMLISAIYSQLMHPLRMIFISLKTGSPLPPSMTTTPMALPLIRWLISTPANLLPPSPTGATTPKPTTTTTKTSSSASATTSTPEATRSRVPILRLRLLRRLLLSSPSWARPLRVATDRGLRLKTGSMTGEKMGTRGSGVVRGLVVRNGDHQAGLKGSVVVRSITGGGGSGNKMKRSGSTTARMNNRSQHHQQQPQQQNYTRR